MNICFTSKSRRRFRNRLGQGLVEFVLIAPLLLILIFGLIHFARAWNIRHVVTDAAREGARNLAVDNGITTDSVTQLIHSALYASGLDTTQATIVLDPGAGTGSPARVTITYPYTIGLMQTMLGFSAASTQFTIGTTFVMRNE